jgi:hypothetical protein
MNAYLVRFRFRVSDVAVRRTWYDVEPHARREHAGASWLTGHGRERCVSRVVLVPEMEDADGYIDERLDYWADQAADRFFPGKAVLGHWDRALTPNRLRVT